MVVSTVVLLTHDHLTKTPFAVRLFSKRSEMTSKCGKNKVVYVPLRECVSDVLTAF